jgi:hypothetical protein
MPTASNLSPKDIELVQREIQEIGEALEAFKTAVEAHEISARAGINPPRLGPEDI